MTSVLKRIRNYFWPPLVTTPLRVVVTPCHADDSRPRVVVRIYGGKSDIKSVQLAITDNTPGAVKLMVVDRDDLDYDRHATQSLYVEQDSPSTAEVGRALIRGLRHAEVTLAAARPEIWGG